MPVKINRKPGDEETLLQSVERNSLDAVVSCLSLHWVNDLPGLLVTSFHPLLVTYPFFQ